MKTLTWPLLAAAALLLSCNGDNGADTADAPAPVATDPTPALPQPGAPGTGSTPPVTPPPVVSPPVTAPPVASAPPPATPAVALDADGVQMLLPSASGKANLALGQRNPTQTRNFSLDEDMPVTPGTDGAIAFWNTVSYVLDYAEGGNGYSVRLNLNASGGTQKFNWHTQQGFLSSEADAKNQEFTVFLRAHQLLDIPHAQATLKVRGGSHTDSAPDAASCVMMTFAPAEAQSRTRFGKELTHPDYDYVTLKRAFDASLPDGKWVGLKMVSFNMPGDSTRVVNRLFVDTDPFDRVSGKPQNHWRQFSEYIDVEGKSSGMYTKLVDWGGWINTLRVDGYHDIDFALPSVREIVPPQ